MRKKFSIVEIDINKIFKEIDDYECRTGDTDPYIFMNGATAIELESLAHFDPVEIPYSRSGTVAEFDGYKIFRNDDLGFGEIEIR